MKCKYVDFQPHNSLNDDHVFFPQHHFPVCRRRCWFWGDDGTHWFQKYMTFLIDIDYIDDYDWYLQVMFFTVFFAFAQLGYLLFGTQVIIAATQRQSYIFYLSVCLFNILQSFLCWYIIQSLKGGGLQKFQSSHVLYDCFFSILYKAFFADTKLTIKVDNFSSFKATMFFMSFSFQYFTKLSLLIQNSL